MGKMRIFMATLSLWSVVLLADAQPAAPAMWIWGESPVNETVKSTTCFRLPIQLDDDPVAGECFLILDDNGAVYVNGRELHPVFFEQEKRRIQIRKFNLKPLLRKGVNVLAIQVNNNGGPGGLILKGTIRLADGRQIALVSDSRWQTSMTPVERWRQPDFDGQNWGRAKIIGGADQQPWAKMSNAVEFFGIGKTAKK